MERERKVAHPAPLRPRAPLSGCTWHMQAEEEKEKAARHPANRGPHLAHDDWFMMRVASTRRPRDAQITQQMHISVMRSALR